MPKHLGGADGWSSVQSHAVATPSPTDDAPRRRGRPRVAPVGEGGGDPAEEILRAAGRLFAERGVAATTMTQLAQAVGLRQSSLYYYFARKEEVVAALVARANVVPLELVGRIDADGGSAPARLHRFVRADVVAMCELPFDIAEIHRIAARDRDGFATYWKERRSLERRLGAIVRAGVADGSLRQVEPRLTTLVLLSNDEGVQNWYRHSAGSTAAPSAIGRAMADLVVGGLLAPSVELDSVRAEAEALERDAPG
jgi:TetR/AcrR family transcriptional regulator